MKKIEPKKEIIEFIRQRDYVFVKELEPGACGETVLLYDDQIEEHFVCKKFTPYSEDKRQELFSNFLREIKILHKVFHKNIVRVFNSYLYPDKLTGYILMEFVQGNHIDDYIAQNPEQINEVFLQTISGFKHLEENNILHRDIRPANVMVREDGQVKIIDFGFGKQIQDSQGFDKSVSLNWWCELPVEFSENTYDFCTEVYFVGKLFERIIQDSQISHFKYHSMLSKMCAYTQGNRVQHFADITKEIQSDMFFEIEFEEEEIESYRNFANEVENHITKIHNLTKYIDDVELVQTRLANAYRGFTLEETVPNAALILRCVIEGAYHYTKKGFHVWAVRDFIHLLKSSSPEKKRIILSNLHTRLDAILRYDDPDVPDINDDLPF